jgi:hypothetical protein
MLKRAWRLVAGSFGRDAGYRNYGESINDLVGSSRANLRGLAQPSSVYDQVKRKLASGFDDLGAQAVKNIAEPVHGYRVRQERYERSRSHCPCPTGLQSSSFPSTI